MACTLDAQGRQLDEARTDRNAAAALPAGCRKIGTPSEEVIEDCRNRSVADDLFDDTVGVAKVVLSHPAKNCINADALAALRRGDVVARVHMPSRGVGQRKNVVRQRLRRARVHTMIRNRIH